MVVLVSGVEAAGKGEVVNRLNEWLDTRGVQTFAFWDETDEERARPRYWRFWRTLPPRGEITILFGGWYLAPIEHRFQGHCTDAELDAELNRIVDFERMLIQDGALIVKFWFHMSEKNQKRRLKALSRDDRSRWKMMPDKAKFSEHYRPSSRSPSGSSCTPTGASRPGIWWRPQDRALPRPHGRQDPARTPSAPA